MFALLLPQLTACTPAIGVGAGQNHQNEVKGNDDDKDDDSDDDDKDDDSDDDAPEDADQQTCAPAGTYFMNAPVATAEGSLCTRLAEQIERSLADSDVIIAEVDEKTFEFTSSDDEPDAPQRRASVDSTKCELTYETTTSASIKDLSGKLVVGRLATTATVNVTETGLTKTVNAKVTSTTSGAKGFPCSIQVVQRGTKKKTT